MFDGLSTDSFAVDTGSAGKFTGACSYMGYPVFFKEDAIYKVYGSKPSNYELLASASIGVKEGSAASLAIAGERLFYLSRVGVMMYTGGMPTPVGAPLGSGPRDMGVGGSDGLRYYLSSISTNGFELNVYDTERGMWQPESCPVGGASGVRPMSPAEGCTCWAATDRLSFLPFLRGALPPEGYTVETGIVAIAEFGDFTEGNPNAKSVSKLQLRVGLDAGAQLTVYISYDRSSTWTAVSTLSAASARSFYLPLIPRRLRQLSRAAGRYRRLEAVFTYP